MFAAVKRLTSELVQPSSIEKRLLIDDHLGCAEAVYGPSLRSGSAHRWGVNANGTPALFQMTAAAPPGYDEIKVFCGTGAVDHGRAVAISVSEQFRQRGHPEGVSRTENSVG